MRVRARYAGGFDGDQHFVVIRQRFLPFDDVQHFGTAGLGDFYGSHGFHMLSITER
jgi:hypothetical protein